MLMTCGTKSWRKQWKWFRAIFFHLFQRCPWKMMSKVSRGRHKHGHDEGTWTDGCMGWSIRKRVLVFCLLSTFYRHSGLWADHMICHAAFKLSVSIWHKGHRPIQQAWKKLSLGLSQKTLLVSHAHLLPAKMISDQDWEISVNTVLSWLVWWRGKQSLLCTNKALVINSTQMSVHVNKQS